MQQALAIPWRRRADFARALAVPLALLAGFYLAWYLVDEPERRISGWTAVFVYWLAFAIRPAPRCSRSRSPRFRSRTAN